MKLGKLLYFVSLLMVTFSMHSRMNFFKNFGVGAGVVIAGLMGLRETNLYVRDCQYKSMSDDAAIVNPELHDVFMKIKSDYGIKENVRLRIFKNDSGAASLIGAEGLYDNYSNSVYLFLDHISKAKIIHNIAHELEHHRQYYKYSGSFPFSYMKWCNNEQGADAASAGYQNCYDCLKEVTSDVTWKHEPNDTAYGFFTTASGYFSPQDYDLYAQEALRNNAQCTAHKRKTHENPQTSLRDFLPINDKD